MTPLWKWPMANLPSNILPVLLSRCREQGGEQRHSGLVEHHLKWLTPQSVGFLEWCPKCLFPSILHLVEFFVCFLPTFHICILLVFSSTQFLVFQKNPIAAILSESWGWFFLWGFVFHVFCLVFYWEEVFLCIWFVGAGHYLRGILQCQYLFFFKKNLHFSPIYYFSLTST